MFIARQAAMWSARAALAAVASCAASHETPTTYEARERAASPSTPDAAQSTPIQPVLRDALQPPDDAVYTSTEFRFALRAIPEWIVLPSLAAREAASDAVFMAATQSPAGAGAALIHVVREAEPDLDAHVVRLSHELRFDAPRVTTDGHIDVSGRTARHLEIDGTVDGEPRRMIATVFARGGYVFELVVTIPVAIASRARDLLDGFVTLAGAIAPPVWFDRIPDRVGPGYRIANGQIGRAHV
jgi:hypothetical protein